MQVVLLTNDTLKQELLSKTVLKDENIIWIEHISEAENYKGSDAFIDLLFEKDHLPVLKAFSPKLVIINSVVDTLTETDTSFVRINGWPTFLHSALIEASVKNEQLKQLTEEIFCLFNKKVQWLADEPGFITPRVISMIINEAFLALQEGVSSKDEIDIAMKLGTNYPYGPFEWAEKIGRDKIRSLLLKLSVHEVRYTPFIPVGT